MVEIPLPSPHGRGDRLANRMVLQHEIRFLPNHAGSVCASGRISGIPQAIARMTDNAKLGLALTHWGALCSGRLRRAKSPPATCAEDSAVGLAGGPAAERFYHDSGRGTSLPVLPTTGDQIQAPLLGSAMSSQRLGKSARLGTYDQHFCSLRSPDGWMNRPGYVYIKLCNFGTSPVSTGAGTYRIDVWEH